MNPLSITTIIDRSDVMARNGFPVVWLTNCDGFAPDGCVPDYSLTVYRPGNDPVYIGPVFIHD